MISEKIELLGKGLYSDIPDVLTLHSIPTASELEYVGSEDFDKTMLDKILPAAIEEKINFKNLLEVDYYWICRCLRMVNFGPYFTTNSVFCSDCSKVSYGDFQVNLNTVDCVPIPAGFTNDILVSRDEFLDFQGDIHLKLLTIQECLNAYKDKAFQNPQGGVNRELARICYMITSIGGNNKLNPVEVKMKIQKDLSPADYIVLKGRVDAMTDFGVRAGGKTQCPKCHSMNANAITYDRYQEPVTVDSFETEQDAVDKLIDQLEADGCDGCFVNPDEYNEDEYVIGGNHGLALYHGGNFYIELIT